MLSASLANAQAETLRRLSAYRTDRKLTGQTGKGARQRAYLARWAAAIERVLDMYRLEQPEKARAMDRLFGLTHAVPRAQGNRGRMLRLADDFCISESTLYKWREEILITVLMAAVETKALAPFAITKMPKGQSAENTPAAQTIEKAPTGRTIENTPATQAIKKALGGQHR